MNELFTLVAFSVLRLSGIRDGRRLLARRTAVAGDAVLVDPSADVGAELFFELPELRPLGEVVFQVVCPEDRGADAGELQCDLLPLVLGDGRKVRRKDQTVSYFEKSKPRNSTLSAARTADKVVAPNSMLRA